MSVRGNYSPRNIGAALLEALAERPGADLGAMGIKARAQILLDPTRVDGDLSGDRKVQHLHCEAFVSTCRDLEEAFGLQLSDLSHRKQREALFAFAQDLIELPVRK